MYESMMRKYITYNCRRYSNPGVPNQWCMHPQGVHEQVQGVQEQFRGGNKRKRGRKKEEGEKKKEKRII